MEFECFVDYFACIYNSIEVYGHYSKQSIYEYCKEHWLEEFPDDKVPDYTEAMGDEIENDYYGTNWRFA